MVLETNNNKEKLKIGVSGCLLGNAVRFDGQHARSNFVLELAKEHAEFISFCPEVEMGMSVPRETVRLVQQNGEIVMKGSRSSKDYTSQMRDFSYTKAKALIALDLDACIVKSKSPSCGMERVKVYLENGHPTKRGSGMFTATLQDLAPDLPIEEEGRLNDPVLRENFFLRVYARRRVKQLFQKEWSRGEVVEFHRQEKFLLLSQNESSYRKLGQLVANIAQFSKSNFKEQYISLYLASFENRFSVKRHVNTLCHMYGFLKNDMSESAKSFFHDTLANFRSHLIPLSVVVAVLHGLVHDLNNLYLDKQSYLQPFPKTLSLRNFTTA
jgi:uncharacterized protein YbbK (DUF523 family)/uncharacterized protein YbgA (DUF1722 family)